MSLFVQRIVTYQQPAEMPMGHDVNFPSSTEVSNTGNAPPPTMETHLGALPPPSTELMKSGETA